MYELLRKYGEPRKLEYALNCCVCSACMQEIVGYWTPAELLVLDQFPPVFPSGPGCVLRLLDCSDYTFRLALAELDKYWAAKAALEEPK